MRELVLGRISVYFWIEIDAKTDTGQGQRAGGGGGESFRQRSPVVVAISAAERVSDEEWYMRQI